MRGKTTTKSTDSKSSIPIKGLKLVKNENSVGQPQKSVDEEMKKRDLNSLFKDNQKLKHENAKLNEIVNKLQEEINYKDEFLIVVNTISEEKHNEKRILMYLAKLRKQERLVIFM